MYCFLVLVPELESQRQKMFSVKKKKFYRTKHEISKRNDKADNDYFVRGSITARLTLLFDWFGFDHTSKSVSDSPSKAKQPNPNEKTAGQPHTLTT